CVLAPSEAQNVLPGRYRIVATLRIPNKFNLSSETIVNVAEEPVENVVVLVTPSQRITGRLEIEDSSPEVRQAVEAGQLHVNLRPNPSLAFLSGSAVAGKDGAFVLNDVGVVHYRVELFGLPADAYIASARLGYSGERFQSAWRFDWPDGNCRQRVGWPHCRSCLRS